MDYFFSLYGMSVMIADAFTGGVASDQPRDIQWRVDPVPFAEYMKLKQFVMKTHDYSRNIDGCRELCPGIPVDTLESIRNIILKSKFIAKIGQQTANVATIDRKYKTADITDIAAEYDYSPLNLLRSVLIYRGMSPCSLYPVFSGREPPESVLRDRDLIQFGKALAVDVIVDDAQITKEAEIAEAAFVESMRQLGLRFRTQQDLVDEQMESDGRASLTPDILLTEKVKINGVEISWIEYKNYTLTDAPFLYKSNLKQVAKYHNKWGVGAIVYNRGVVADIALPGAIILGPYNNQKSEFYI